MTRPQVPGQVELVFEVPELGDELRAELAAHVLPGWASMGACRSVADDTWFPDETATARKAAAIDRCGFCPVRRSCLAHALSAGRSTASGVARRSCNVTSWSGTWSMELPWSTRSTAQPCCRNSSGGRRHDGPTPRLGRPRRDRGHAQGPGRGVRRHRLWPDLPQPRLCGSPRLPHGADPVGR